MGNPVCLMISRRNSCAHFRRAKKTVHSRKVDIMLVNRGFFIHRGPLGDNAGYNVRILAVQIHISPHDDGIGTQLPCHLHGHGRMHAVFPGFITAARHHTPARQTADHHRLSVQPAVDQPFHRHEKTVEVEVDDVSAAWILSR